MFKNAITHLVFQLQFVLPASLHTAPLPFTQNISASHTTQLVNLLPSFLLLPFLSYLSWQHKSSSSSSVFSCEGVFVLYPRPETQLICKNLCFFWLAAGGRDRCLLHIFLSASACSFIPQLCFPDQSMKKNPFFSRHSKFHTHWPGCMDIPTFLTSQREEWSLLLGL